MKKAQIFSMDLIIGTIIFMLTLGIFYGLITDTYIESSTEFNLNGDAVFNAIDMDSSLSFMDGYMVYDDGVWDYDKTKKAIRLALQNNMEINNINFCMYFTDDENNKIKEMLGQSSLDISITDSFKCGNTGAIDEISKPRCGDKYKIGVNFRRPIVYKTTSGATESYEILNMNILLCGETND